ncbi:tyrosine-type recombinase/integrase [Salmonella enterica]|nr:tyrosine-type recombinase/integrase [Salmonella enterica]EGM2645748.1 tyrosine-type recombinase/integrase [Salmonella enterica]EGM2983792.1 tyrosine-type recombinase/integrase [Salmonella enterica]EJU6033416.1 tyrosine-type recombinase/integrase [Salmonella enterica]
MSTRRKYLTQSEVERLLETAKMSGNPERDYCLIYMSFIHGFRVSEVRHLRLSDLDLNEGSLYIHRLKQGFSTSHPLLGKEVRAIKAWLKVRRTMPGAENDWLFVSRYGTPLSRQRIYNMIQRLGEKAGLSLCSHPHMLRHACGFALADRGIDTRLIQDYLGHRNIRHTVRYTASNAERFEGVWRSKSKRKKIHLGPNC